MGWGGNSSDTILPQPAARLSGLCKARNRTQHGGGSQRRPARSLLSVAICFSSFTRSEVRGPALQDILRALTFTDTTEANASRSELPAGSASRPTV
jgi:hypothetical protein